jgi:hypothetical protein
LEENRPALTFIVEMSTNRSMIGNMFMNVRKRVENCEKKENFIVILENA